MQISRLPRFIRYASALALAVLALFAAMVVEGRSYLPEYAKPGSKAAAEGRGGRGGVAARVRTALGELGVLRR